MITRFSDLKTIRKKIERDIITTHCGVKREGSKDFMNELIKENRILLRVLNLHLR